MQNNPTPDWHKAEDYEFVRSLPLALIAWQFLRRNPEYQNDFFWFNTTWQSLEADYGSPPNRDFTAWKQDPRAYRSELEIYQLQPNASPVCASQAEQLLIECWMGSKWGFYKFPVDPEIVHPKLAGQLQWRITEATVKLINTNNINDIVNQTNTNKIAIMFDLTKSFKQQLQHAKQLLVVQKKKYSINSSQNTLFILYLRILDALENSVSDDEICKILFPNSGDNINLYIDAKQQSVGLMNGGYRELCASTN